MDNLLNQETFPAFCWQASLCGHHHQLWLMCKFWFVHLMCHDACNLVVQSKAQPGQLHEWFAQDFLLNANAVKGLCCAVSFVVTRRTTAIVIVMHFGVKQRSMGLAFFVTLLCCKMQDIKSVCNSSVRLAKSLTVMKRSSILQAIVLQV